MMDAARMRIQAIGPDDLAVLARAHVESFPDSALSMLGEGVVMRYYGFRFSVSTRLVALGAWEGHRLAGFIVAGTFSSGWRRFIRRHWPILLGATVRRPWIVVRPRFRGAGETVAGWLSPRRVRRAVGADMPKGSVGVMSIGVVPGARRRGVGSVLMEEAERRLRADGVPWLHLSVRSDNWGAIRFYEGQGWRTVEGGAGATVLMRKALGSA